MTDGATHTFEDLQTGTRIPADNGNPVEVKPEWFDQTKFQKTREIFKEYRTSLFYAHLSGLILVFLYTPIIEPFLFTGKSANIPALFRRYLSTSKHLVAWYTGDIWDPNDRGHKSILLVRRMHKNVSHAMDSPTSGMKTATGSLFFSQTAMAHTQFAFMGWLILYSKQIGLYCTKEEMECLLHFWRCVGYLLGMDDRYNICAGDYEESVKLYREIIEKDIKQRLKSPREDGVAMSRDIVTALRKVLPLLSWLGMKRYWYEVLDVAVDFRLGIYDIICYWWYRVLFRIILKNKVLRWFLNKLATFGFNQVVKIYNIL